MFPENRIAFFLAELDANPKYKLVAAGDFNATISSSSKESGLWDYSLGCNNSDTVETSDNGERFMEWCLLHNLKITNSFFRSKRKHHGTWKNPRTKKWVRKDYICTSNWMMKFVQRCRVYIGPSSLFLTDHRLLVMDITFPSTKKHLQKYLSRRPNYEERAVTDFAALRKDVDRYN